MKHEMSCIDEEGHDFEFVGYMVVTDNLPTPETKPRAPKPGKGTIWIGPMLEVPHQFPAKIEVWQCRKCGWISLKPAVFSRI